MGDYFFVFFLGSVVGCVSLGFGMGIPPCPFSFFLIFLSIHYNVFIFYNIDSNIRTHGFPIWIQVVMLWLETIVNQPLVTSGVSRSHSHMGGPVRSQNGLTCQLPVFKSSHGHTTVSQHIELYQALRTQWLHWFCALAGTCKAWVDPARTAFWTEVTLFTMQELVTFTHTVEGTFAKYSQTPLSVP